MTITNYTQALKNTLSWLLVALLVTTSAFVLMGPGEASAQENNGVFQTQEQNDQNQQRAEVTTGDRGTQNNLFQWILLDRFMGQDGDRNDLVSLVVLSNLFGDNGAMFGTTDGSQNWVDLIILDRVVNDGDGRGNLTDLVVLQALFNNENGQTSMDGANRWFDLLILDRVLGDDTRSGGSGLFR